MPGKDYCAESGSPSEGFSGAAGVTGIGHTGGIIYAFFQPVNLSSGANKHFSKNVIIKNSEMMVIKVISVCPVLLPEFRT